MVTPTVEMQGAYTATDLGVSDTATEGTVLKEQLDNRPVYRVGELLENTPGLIVTQHSGEGKANQYFLRGFNLDHGTDMAITVDDMPVNMRSHAHGQGYSDLNFVIPELLSGLDYRKGPYFADEGDFATAGSVHMNYLTKLDRNFVTIGGGSFGYARGATAASHAFSLGTMIAAAEYEHLDGPWQNPDDFNKGNAVLRYAQGDATNGWSATAMAYRGAWNATNQIPERAVSAGQLSSWGNEDPTDGGNAQRFSLSARLAQTDDDTRLKASLYLIQSDLSLWNNFTYYLYNPTQGDQFEQRDHRLRAGGKVSYEMDGHLADRETVNTVGVETLNDWIDLSLNQTYHRHYLSTDRRDRIQEQSISPYYENRIYWTDWLRTTIGVREEIFYGHDIADNPLNSGTAISTKISPKGSLALGPWGKTELYVSWGEGIHSNDVRAATTSVEPTTYNNTAQGISGDALSKFPLLVRAVGQEVGIRTTLIPHLQSSIALFRLNLGSEQVFNGNGGDTSPSAKSTRQGVEFANFYRPIPGLILDADLAVTQARFHGSTEDGITDSAGNAITSGKYIAGSPRTVISFGVAWDDHGPWFGGLQYRFFGETPLVNDNSIRSNDTNLVNVDIGYRLTEAIALRFDVDNLLDAKASQISYYYASRLRSEVATVGASGVNGIHMHPAEPFGVRVSVTAKF